MNDSVAAAFDALGALLHHDLEHDLDINTEEITRNSGSRTRQTLLLRRRQRAPHTVRDSTVILAGEIINDGDRYRSILRP